MKYKLEICSDSLESAVIAENAGADRIELCTSLPEGGTTPSWGLITSVRDNINIPLHVLIRPRASDFLYSDDDFDIMRRDIEMCGEAGVNGVVFGILLSNGFIDIERTSKLISFARPMSVTFHRAFDLCQDPLRSLSDLISTGVDRLLTSGQENKAMEGATLIAELVQRASGKIAIMPGSGIDETNIPEIARLTGATEFHMSGRMRSDSKMHFQKTGVTMGAYSPDGEYTMKIADAKKIEAAKRVIESLVHTSF